MNFSVERAIIKKEILENKGSIFYAPGIILVLFFSLLTLQTLFTNHVEKIGFAQEVYILAIIALSGFFSIYLAITLFFYYASAFSSDRKNNGLLFWKSLPISDLKILGLKFATGTLVLPLIMVMWIVLGAILAYFIGLINFVSFDLFVAPWTAITTLVHLVAVVLLLIIITSLWLAPFYAWVALLSVFFKKWSIALAFVIPAVLILMEEIFSFDAFRTSYLLDFLLTRLTEFADMGAMSNDQSLTSLENFTFAFDNGGQSNMASEFLTRLNQGLWLLLMNIKWLSLISGLFVSAIFVYIGSEYRRRFIQG